jgi:hypothetical protein
MVSLSIEYRGDVKRWCVVHVDSGRIALQLLRSKAAAVRASKELEALPINWESYSAATHRLDNDSMTLLGDLQLKLLGVKLP